MREREAKRLEFRSPSRRAPMSPNFFTSPKRTFERSCHQNRLYEVPPQPEPLSEVAAVELSISQTEASQTPGRVRRTISNLSGKLWTVSALALLILAGTIWLYRSERPKTALDRFWAPVLATQGTPLICSGGVIFAHNGFSGVTTAGKDVDYPFVSMQTASALTRVSTELERGGSNYEVASAPSTSLNQLRERPLVLIGAYNNQWTLQLVSSLRYHFPAEPAESIVDRQNPDVRWKRDRTIGYSNSDDFALVARFHDPTTDGTTVVLAGLGRNGTEAAAQFATSSHYMQLLREKIGKSLDDKNIEVILKIKVIQGKTGAPSIEALHVW